MTLRTFFSAFFLILILLAGMNLVIGFVLGEADNRRSESQRRLNHITSLSEDLVVSSQWATRFARAYVATKDQKILRHYNEIADILDGKIARPTNYGLEYWDLVTGGLIAEPEPTKEGAISLEDQFLKFDLTVEEFNTLKKAEDLFAKMASVETIAIHAIAGEFDDGTGAFSKKGKPDMALAERLLYGAAYAKQNGDLSQLISDFKQMVQARYRGMLAEQEKFASQLIGHNTYLGGALFSIVLAYVLFMRKRVLGRTATLLSAVKEISKGDLDKKIDVQGNDEIGDLAAAVNSMAKNLKMAFEALEDKVSVAEKTADELNSERLRSEKLLHNILPAAIAQRLQGGEEVIAEVFPEVTVFFSDIVGFTDLSAKLGPYNTVNLLNTLFEQFDELVEKHGVEKIKTIGDSYMVVGGIPNRDPLHCQHVAEFALDAMAFVKEFSSTSTFPLQMRMGFHTGTVAAGVVGKKKFSYDLWGDVVNIASRFEIFLMPQQDPCLGRREDPPGR